MRFAGEYPPDWPDIAFAKKQSVAWRCEHCNHEHEPETGYVLTVHHLDGNKSNCSSENLAALCQKCHLHLQASLQPGQIFLPGLRPSRVPVVRIPHLTT